MAHFACITHPAAGHINPFAALSRALIARGHRVTFAHMLDMQAMINPRGLDFVPVGRSSFPAGWIEDAMASANRLGGLPLLFEAARITAMLCRELPDVLRSLSVDMILTDQMELAGGAVAKHLDLPFVSIAAALPTNWEPSIPSPFVGWPYGVERWRRTRNVVFHKLGETLLTRPMGDVLETVSNDWKLGLGRSGDRYLSELAQISQLVPALDFPRRELTQCFHYCGPLRDAPVGMPSERRGHRAFASLGTLQGHRARLFEQIASAAAACRLDLTIAHGGLLPPDAVSRLSSRANVHSFVLQEQVLAQSDVAILHGGLNTVLDALAVGVPMVLVPLAFEQSGIAARVLRAGAGLVCKGRRQREKRLTTMVKTVHEQPSYAAAAATLRNAILASGGTARAADVVETVLRTGKPVVSADLETTRLLVA